MNITIGFRAAVRGSALRGRLGRENVGWCERVAIIANEVRAIDHGASLFSATQCGLEGRTPRARETYGILQFSQFLPGELE